MKSSATTLCARARALRWERCRSGRYRNVDEVRYAPPNSDFQIEQQLVSVIILPKAAKRRPHQVTAIVGARSEIAVEDELAVFPADAKLVVIWIEDFNAVLRALSERRAMPGIFLRAVGARLGLTRPARHFELGAARREPGIYQPDFDLLHSAVRSPAAINPAFAASIV